MATTQQSIVLETVALAGEILLASGAEIFRVDDTMQRIAKAYHSEDFQPFVLGNGIFLTIIDSDSGQSRAKVRHVPLASSRLDKIDAVNQLSREIEQGRHTPAEALLKLKAIHVLPKIKPIFQVLASGLGSAAFCFFYGGTVADSLAAFCAGFCLYAYFVFVVKGRLSKIVTNLSGAALATLVSVLLVRWGLGETLSTVTVGAIIPLLPGVAFTNAIRDIAHEDYISGAVRIMDVAVVVLCTAVGVSAVLFCFGGLGGAF